MAQVLSTMGVTVVGSLGMAVAQERRDVDRAQVQLAAADHAFQQTLAASLRDGTPSASLVPLARQEWQAWHQARQRTFIIDRLLLTDLSARTTRINELRAGVSSAEVAAEEDVAAQLQDELTSLAQDVASAHQAGVGDAGVFDRRVAGYRAWSGVLVIPNAGRSRLTEVQVFDNAVREATAAKQAADAAVAAALQAAKDDAGYQHDRAHADLAQAQAIPVLQVGQAAATIAAIDDRPTPQTADDFEVLAGLYADQARWLENLLYIRGNTYAQLAAARAMCARAAALGVDVSGFMARLDAANRQLDAAPDVSSILAAADTIRDVRTAVDGAYAYARAHPPPPPGSVILNVPFFAQVYSLDCEEAALQMALASEGINVSQDAILNTIGVDGRAPQLDANGNVVHWGDPYANFVGDPNGYRESAQYGSRSGYGTYDEAIARAATSLGGHVVRWGERIPAGDLYNEVHNRHPSVVWVAWEYSPHGTTTYQAWDGRVVMYGAPWEHAVTLIGESPGSVLINNPHGGQQWVSKSTFEAAYAMFDQMAVVMG